MKVNPDTLLFEGLLPNQENELVEICRQIVMEGKLPENCEPASVADFVAPKL